MKIRDYTAENLKYLRTKNNLTYKELAKIINVHYSSIGYAEQGKQKYSKVARKIGSLFGIDSEILSAVDLETLAEMDMVYKSDYQMGYVVDYSYKDHMEERKKAVCVQSKLVWILEHIDYKVYEATYCNISEFVRTKPEVKYFQKYDDQLISFEQLQQWPKERQNDEAQKHQKCRKCKFYIDDGNERCTWYGNEENRWRNIDSCQDLLPWWCPLDKREAIHNGIISEYERPGIKPKQIPETFKKVVNAEQSGHIQCYEAAKTLNMTLKVYEKKRDAYLKESKETSKNEES